MPCSDMDAVKHRRMLTQTDLLSILESDAAEMALAEARLGEIAGQILDGLYEPGMFTRLVKSGALEASTVNVGEEPAFVMLYTRNLIGWLTVEGVAGLGRAPLARLFEAGDANRTVPAISVSPPPRQRGTCAATSRPSSP